MPSRSCLVTGSNKGIGLEAVRQISKKYTDNDFVYLTSRDEQRGKKAMKTLNEEGLKNIRYLQLDVEDVQSINLAAAQISKAHGKLDVLVNNAGIHFNPESTTPFNQQAEVSEHHQKTLTSSDLRIKDITDFVNDFMEKTKTNSHKEAGYSANAYGMSKLAMIAMTKVHAREFAKDNITVVAVSPGYCRTDMTGGKGFHSASEGAEIITWLVTKENIQSLSGEFLDRKNYGMVET